MLHSSLGRLLLALLVAVAGLPPSEAGARQAADAGRLVIIGGGLSRQNDAVYRSVLEARQGSGPICVIPTASASPESSISSAVTSFETHGGPGAAVGIGPLTVDEPASAHDPSVVEALGRCSGYFFVGGVQSRIVTVLRPDGSSTPALEAIMRRFREGAVVSGSSAGAAIMSDPMIAGGAAGAMEVGSVSITPGLGFFQAGLVDQHFLARGRFGRLVSAVVELPDFDLGFGIDENTALVVEGGAVWSTGTSAVVVVDAAGARTEGGTTTGVRLHLMSTGDRFDLASRSLSIDGSKRPLAGGSAVPVPEDLFSSWTLFHLLDGFGPSPQVELSVPVEGGRIVLRKAPDFDARGLDGEGVRGTTAGLSLSGLTLERHRAPD